MHHHIHHFARQVPHFHDTTRPGLCQELGQAKIGNGGATLRQHHKWNVAARGDQQQEDLDYQLQKI